MAQILMLHAGNRSDGTPVEEEVIVEPLVADQFRIIQSPGLVLGLAADDVIRVTDDGHPEVITRGNNLCVQVFVFDQIDALEATLSRDFAALGGKLDGRSAKELVYTIPVKAGFAAVERVLKCVDSANGAEWFYGNVYDIKDGVTPLNWW